MIDVYLLVSLWIASLLVVWICAVATALYITMREKDEEYRSKR